MYSLQIWQLVIIRIHARAKEKACVSSVYDLVVAELDEVGLVFLIAGCYQSMDLSASVYKPLKKAPWKQLSGQRTCHMFSEAVKGSIPRPWAWSSLHRCRAHTISQAVFCLWDRGVSFGKYMVNWRTYCRFWMRMKESTILTFAHFLQILRFPQETCGC